MRAIASTRRAAGFTLVELMITCTIVAILALSAVPMYRGNVEAAKMTEGVAAVGTIRTALRVHAATHDGQYPDLSARGDELAFLGIHRLDLDGKYFTPDKYEVLSEPTGYVITARYGDVTYEVNERGEEVGTYRTGQ